MRVLEGPNLYFPRPAIKVTLALPGLLNLDSATMASLCREVGVRRSHPGAPGSATRQQVLLRCVERVVRALSAAVGTTRLAVRCRPGSASEQVIAAYVWRHRGRAEALGHAIGPTLEDVLAGMPLAESVATRGPDIASVPSGPPARIITARIPVASVTGTNGKTTTTRLLAHIGMTAGLHTAWSSTDGVLDQGRLVEAGDYSGPGGARMVLACPGVQLGILETARGGMLLKGLGVSHNDVAVVTNVTADHLGSHGIDTVDQLAEVKAIITRATRPQGWVVLNGDDPRVWAMRTGIKARPWVFTLSPSSPAIREALDRGGRASTVLDGWITVLGGGRTDRIIRVVDTPVTLSGLSEHNVANALAATSAALGLGISRSAVVEGLRTFAPDAELNPGRMNVYSLPVPDEDDSGAGVLTVIVDLAHNEAGLEALLDVARGLCAPGGRVHLALGTAGDRTDDILQALGEIAGRRADHVVVVHKQHYLRGRTTADLEHQYHLGLARSGVAVTEAHPTELEGLSALVASADPGDVVAVMCHSERTEVVHWLLAAGGTADGHEDIRRKVIAARGEHEAEERIEGLWALPDSEARLAEGAVLRQAHPGDARVAYEYGSVLDAAGESAQAVPLYEEALTTGLSEPYRHRCQVQLAVALRDLGRVDEARSHAVAARERHPESLGIAAFAALVEHDAGDAAGALGRLLGVIAATSTDADVERYRDELSAHATELTHRG